MNLKYIVALMLTFTLALMTNAMHIRNNPMTGSLTLNSQPEETPYTIWLKEGADVSVLSEEQVFEFIADTFQYNEPEALNMFKKLVSTLSTKDYEAVFTPDVLYRAIDQTYSSEKNKKELQQIQADALEKLRILVHQLIKNNDSVIMQRIQDALVKIKNTLNEKLQDYRNLNLIEVTQTIEGQLKNFYQTQNAINQMIQEERELVQKRKILMTAPKGSATFKFE